MDKATAAYFRMNAAKQMKGKKNMSELGKLYLLIANVGDKNFGDNCCDQFDKKQYLALVTTKLKLAEKSKIIYEEQPNYTKEELLADIGGALGLFLGLNLLDVLLFLGQILKVIITKTLDAIAHIKVA